MSVHKVCYFVDRLCIFSPKGYENAIFKVVAAFQAESIMCLHYRQTRISNEAPANDRCRRRDYVKTINEVVLCLKD